MSSSELAVPVPEPEPTPEPSGLALATNSVDEQVALIDAEKAKTGQDKALEYMSHSRLNVYNSCGWKFKVIYLDGVPKAASGFFLAGIAIHETIQESETQKPEWFRDAANFERDGAATKFFLARFDELVAKNGGPEVIYWGGRNHGENYPWWVSQGPVMLKRYGVVRRTDISKGYELGAEAVELKIRATLPNGMGLEIRVDAFLMVNPDGERIIRDWKTGRVGQSDPLQLATYAYGIEQAMGVHAYGTEFVYLRAADEEKRYGDLDVTDLVPLVPRLYGDLQVLIRAGHFPIRPSWMCKSCNVKDFCPYGSKLADD